MENINFEKKIKSKTFLRPKRARERVKNHPVPYIIIFLFSSLSKTMTVDGERRIGPRVVFVSLVLFASFGV